MATKMKGIYKSFKYISQIFVVKEREMEIGYPTDVKHVAHIGWDGQSGSAPSWMNEFKAAPDFSTSIDFEQSMAQQPASEVLKDVPATDLPNVPKKHKRKKKSSTSSPKSSSSTRSSRAAKTKALFHETETGTVQKFKRPLVAFPPARYIAHLEAEESVELSIFFFFFWIKFQLSVGQDTDDDDEKQASPQERNCKQDLSFLRLHCTIEIVSLSEECNGSSLGLQCHNRDIKRGHACAQSMADVCRVQHKEILVSASGAVLMNADYPADVSNGMYFSGSP
ncbi:hypothetical protein JRO89_XS06G0178800 [Xanthoceras sorbifolium]|uniref:CRIB domain-containing protein n=1 Tax=Xanthoceras sorbifolium TaxID=99658 RepID=A0ABQ8HYT7_9ROSI|nr:hypothetical protein JRO89_XS06G0178800 [Xanthoceras sorbifolium]